MTGWNQRVESPRVVLRRQIAELFRRRPCRGRPEVPRRLSHYKVRGKIGEGGNGIVYLAQDEFLNRLVAIKVLRGKLIQDSERRERFIREAQLQSALNHPNIVTVHEFDRDQGLDFVVMEYVPGETLAQRVPGRGLRLAVASRYALQIASAVKATHSLGIAHRDLKPTNFIVSSNDTVKLLDFGLAKIVAVAGQEECPGKLYGTVGYMSPEQCRGETTQQSSDVFSLGAILYELFSGRPAFKGRSPIRTMRVVLTEDPAPLPNRIPLRIARIIKRCLERESAQRYPTAAELLHELTLAAPSAMAITRK